MTRPLDVRLLGVSYPLGSRDNGPVTSGAEMLERRGARLTWPTTQDLVHGHLAGTDDERLIELLEAVRGDHDVVWVARAGYGQARLLGRMRWEASARPRPLVGFSDATALANAWWHHLGWHAVHGPNVRGLDEVPPTIIDDVLELLGGGVLELDWPLDHVTGPVGDVTGPMCGGNLTTLVCGLAARHFELPQDGVVVLEEAFEPPHAVDRMLCVLRDGGFLDRASAVVVGDVDVVEPTSGQPALTVREIVAEVLAPAGLPVWAGAPVGHRADSQPFVVGASCTLAGGRLAQAARLTRAPETWTH